MQKKYKYLYLKFSLNSHLRSKTQHSWRQSIIGSCKEVKCDQCFRFMELARPDHYVNVWKYAQKLYKNGILNKKGRKWWQNFGELCRGWTTSELLSFYLGFLHAVHHISEVLHVNDRAVRLIFFSWGFSITAGLHQLLLRSKPLSDLCKIYYKGLQKMTIQLIPMMLFSITGLGWSKTA